MAYREPGVTVTQEFVNALPALAAFSLPSVTVGPIFQVVKSAPAGTYTGVLDTFAWATKLPGAVVDLRAVDPLDLVAFPPAVSFGNAVVEELAASTGDVLLASPNHFTDATPAIFAGIVAGDVVNIALGANAGSYTVRQVIDDNTLLTNETFLANESLISYTIRRNLGTVSGIAIAATDVLLGVDLAAGLTIGGKTVLQATVLLSYRALRLENSSDVKEYGGIPELQADFGIDQIVPENPAVFGAYVALGNSVTKHNILGLKEDFLTDELLAYTEAADVLKLTDMYAIAVLTQQTAVHTMIKAHVEGMSVPAKKLERVGICNRRIVLVSTVVDTLTTGGSEGLSASGLILTSAASTFITDGVVPGHFVVITAPSLNAGRYKIAAVTSQTVVVLATAASVGAVVSVSFSVEKDLTKPEQANVIAAYARSIGSRRLVLTWPDIVKLPVGNQIRQVPGYFFNSCVAALTTGLPTQQGLTNLNVALFTGLIHSTKYFDNDQLNLIADGGVMIFAQDVLDQTALYVRHQLTTDRSAIKFQEYSVTKNVDFICKFIRSNHRQFPGKYNVVDNAFDDLKTNAKGIISFLKEKTRQPKIGGVIKGGKLASVVQDPANIDTILERYEMDIPIPLNNLDITVAV